MKVVRLTIERFRCIKAATLHFDGHTLLVGPNNVGKSTVCEALDLVLGPDRLRKQPPVQEYDFYNAVYLDADGAAVPARVEVVLVDLTSEVELACATHIELWHSEERRILGEGEIDEANPPLVQRCLRLETVARYVQEDDEFEAETFFCHATSNPDGSPEQVRWRTKRLFGFLYLRALRTASRALSLERGSLLDVILRLRNVRTTLWERSITRLRELNPPIADDAADIAPVLASIEQRVGQYIPLEAEGGATHLFVSQLTREHLRKTISFFLSTHSDQAPVPFQEVGTGTLNALVLALLSFIADVNPGNVIFAMEEPEIALPPHTQRRIANYLLTKTRQCFVTSHSPYVIERFGPEQVVILRRDSDAAVSGHAVSVDSTIKEKMYRRHSRRALAEAMLGRAVIVTEGLTEQMVLSAVADALEAADEVRYPLDLSGVTIISTDGEGSVPAFGAFFKNLGLRSYAFYDQKTRSAAEQQRFLDAFELPCETPYTGIEKLLVAETPLDRQWDFLAALRDAGTQGHLGIPAVRPADEALRDLMLSALKSNKGNGYAAGLLGLCAPHEFPITITAFLKRLYDDFPRPVAIPVPEAATQADSSSPESVAPASLPASKA